MNFDRLKLIFSIEMKKVKDNPAEKNTRFILAAYKKVLKIISSYHDDKEKVSASKINALPITENMKNKLLAILMGRQVIKKPEVADTLNIKLNNLLGVGKKKIDELIAAGLKNEKQLYTKKYFDMLNKDTQLMLIHKPLRKIPHEDIKKIEVKLTACPGLFVQLVGSFRRKLPYSKDIDILVRSNDINALDIYTDYLRRRFTNNVYIYTKGKDKISLIIAPFLEKDNDEPDRALKYKLDIFRCGPETYYTNLLYSTGSKEFNIRMRGIARRAGYLLNQNGLFKNGKKINNHDDDEKALFSFLNMKYLRPEDRI